MSTAHACADRPLTGHEVRFGDDEVIVSKTDPDSRITYVNEVFLKVSGYAESEVLGQPHNIIRHPAMPRCVFKLLWDTIRTGTEIFAYVVNRARNGDHYWVFAHVTPTFDAQGRIINYHSNRRCPARSVIPKVEALYARLLAVEQAAADRESGMQASTALLHQILSEAGLQYDEWVFSLAASALVAPDQAQPATSPLTYTRQAA